MSQQAQPDSRVRGALFTPPAIEQAAPAEVATEDAVPSQVAESAISTQSAAAPAPRARKRVQKQAKVETAALQVHLPVAIWQAFKWECIKRRVPASVMIQRVLVAQLPSVASAARNQAA